MKSLSTVAQAIEPSATLAIDALYKQMLAEGKDVVGFGAGEPDFNTPDNIKMAALQAITANMTRYTPAVGTVELRKAICNRLKTDFGLNYEPSQIAVSSGAKPCVFTALQALLNPGDEVILPSPFWVSYIELIRMAGGVPVIIETTEADAFKISAERLAEAITDKTKCMILNNPCNPTGMMYTREELEGIAKVCVEKDIYVISDEIYCCLVYDKEKFTSFASLGEEIKERTIIINGVSKAYAMTGWRMGYLCAPRPIAAQMLKLHQFGIMSAPTTAQFAAIEAMRNGDDDVAMMRAEYNRRRRYLTSGLRALGMPCFEPEGAFYAFPNVAGFGLSSEEFCERLLTEYDVAIVPGGAFGACGEGFARISYAYSVEHISKALDRMEAFVKELRK